MQSQLSSFKAYFAMVALFCKRVYTTLCTRFRQTFTHRTSISHLYCAAFSNRLLDSHSHCHSVVYRKYTSHHFELSSRGILVEPFNTWPLRKSIQDTDSRTCALDRDRLRCFDCTSPYGTEITLAAGSEVGFDGVVPGRRRVSLTADFSTGQRQSLIISSTCIASCIRYSTVWYSVNDVTCKQTPANGDLTSL